MIYLFLVAEHGRILVGKWVCCSPLLKTGNTCYSWRLEGGYELVGVSRFLKCTVADNSHN